MGYVFEANNASSFLTDGIGSLAFLSLWSVVAFNMSNLQLGSSLLSVGLNWWQSIVATLLGHIIAAGVVVIVSCPGLYYHISFPVSQRMTWGEISWFQSADMTANGHRVQWCNLCGAESNPPFHHLVRRPKLARRIDDIRMSQSLVS